MSGLLTMDERRVAGAEAIADALRRSAAYEGLNFTISPMWDQGSFPLSGAKTHVLRAAIREGLASAEIPDDLVVGCGADSAAAWVEVYTILNRFVRKLRKQKDLTAAAMQACGSF